MGVMRELCTIASASFADGGRVMMCLLASDDLNFHKTLLCLPTGVAQGRDSHEVTESIGYLLVSKWSSG